MTDEDWSDLPFTTSEDNVPVIVRPSRRHRHEWTSCTVDHGGPCPDGMTCWRCGKRQDPIASRRGRSSLRAGKDAERAIAKAYPNARRTGMFGGPDDVVVGELFVVQSKAGGWFSERVWAELVKLQGGPRIPTLVVSDRPGPGHRTRRYVVRTLEDDVSLHGAKP